jgi:predicted metal-dependent hydrolase
MTARWGSCTKATSSIRISTRLGPFPDWVLDYVIVHELAHLVHLDHSPAFWELVHRYPRAERATGYLIAKSGDDDEQL